MKQAVIKGTNLPFNAIKQLLRAHESLSMYQEMTTGT
jgi:hypothetical protein